ncbi:MAG: hypothetical protein JRN62_03335 [Nitrososphaerota archaeon]|jgi:hypothetical protein|nr:hypothetical protein [Nitrososphaerota archaeon]MDG6948631.1 hypothetical protein [Nitrososphaerota archaeon]
MANNQAQDLRDQKYECRDFIIEDKEGPLILLTYGPDQAKQLISEFQNIDGKRLAEEKLVRAFIDRLYQGGFIVAHISKTQAGLASKGNSTP